MKGNLRPLRGYILVEQIDDEGKTTSGLIMPETAKDKPIKGIVLSMGADAHECSGMCNPKRNLHYVWKDEQQPQVKVGDKVVYKRWSTTDLEENGKKLSFVAFGDILGVYED